MAMEPPNRLISVENLKPTDKIVGINMQDQPKPIMTMVELQSKLDELYVWNSAGIKHNNADSFKKVNGGLHELIGIVTKMLTDLESIHSNPPAAPEAITKAINTEKAEFSVCGVQLWENGSITGVSLYSTVHKAKTIRDILNAKFAELRVKHDARIINYPVY